MLLLLLLVVVIFSVIAVPGDATNEQSVQVHGSQALIKTRVVLMAEVRLALTLQNPYFPRSAVCSSLSSFGGLEHVLLSRSIPQQEALRRVKRSFKGCLDLNSHLEGDSSEDEQIGKGAGGDDSDDDLMATATRLSLRCPLGLVSAQYSTAYAGFNDTVSRFCMFRCGSLGCWSQEHVSCVR